MNWNKKVLIGSNEPAGMQPQRFRQEGNQSTITKIGKGHIHLVLPTPSLMDLRATSNVHSIPEVALIPTCNLLLAPGTTGDAKRVSLKELL